MDFRHPVTERSGADQCNLRRKVQGGSSGGSAGSAWRGNSEKGEQQVGCWWTDEHCPYIHGAGRTAVIGMDHGAVRRAELSTREGGQLRCERGARWICGQCGVGKNSGGRARWAYPLDDGVGRSAGPLRDARTPQTGMNFARAAVSPAGRGETAARAACAGAARRIAGRRGNSVARQRGRTS